PCLICPICVAKEKRARVLVAIKANGKPVNEPAKVEEPANVQEPAEEEGGCPAHEDPGEEPRIERFSIGELLGQYPRLHPPVLEGLVREGETANIISLSKIGKSWFAYLLALSIVTGRPFLGRFATSQGRVLLIDNELHKPTIASRIRTVADALDIP